MSPKFRFAALVSLLVMTVTPGSASAGDAPAEDGEPLCFGRVPTIIGTDAGEEIIGTDGTDVILGLGGADIIHGMGGRDFICAGSGKDVVYGGLGGDKIDGQGGDDQLFGNGGTDRIKGSRGDDFVDGGKKEDFANGGGGSDICDAEGSKRCQNPIAIDVELVTSAVGAPVFVTSRTGDDRLYLVSQAGSVYSLDGALGAPTTVLDIEDLVRFSGERGLLGLAFHPDDPERMFINYIEDGTNDTVVAEYEFPLEDDVAGAEVQEILRVDQPATNHNGGMLAFGPDGNLWIGLGDGGGQDDQFGNGQNINTLLASILRIDVDGGPPYSVPADNPFVGVDGADEIWAMGARNPWRFSFDGDDLFIADVGQRRWEEVSVVDAGGPGVNLGWSILEGSECFEAEDCDRTGFTEPVYAYFHDSGRCSITGGYVYRGAAVPGLEGVYVFGDYCTGELFGLVKDKKEWVFQPIEVAPLVGLTSFGLDGDGELYATASGSVYRITTNGA